MNRHQKQLLRKQQLEPFHKERVSILLRDKILKLTNIYNFNEYWSIHCYFMEHFASTPFRVKTKQIGIYDYEFKLVKN